LAACGIILQQKPKVNQRSGHLFGFGGRKSERSPSHASTLTRRRCNLVAHLRTSFKIKRGVRLAWVKTKPIVV
jgi:hypothetical protein